MYDDFPENFSRILINSSWEMDAIFILIIGICLQNTLRVEKERWAASNIQELDWHSQLDYVTLPVDTVSRIQCQEGVLYPSWIPVARLKIKLTQDRLTEKKKEEMNFNSCAWRSPRNGSWEVVKQALDCVLLPTSNKCAYSTAGMFLVVLG